MDATKIGCKLTKKQHYVPVWYLNNFTDSEGFVYGWNKSNDNCFKARPVDICRADYLYETEWTESPDNAGFVLANQIEKSFSVEEGKYSKLVRKVLSIVQDSSNKGAVVCRSKEERETMASLVANLYLRNPVVIEAEAIRLIPDEIMEHEVVKNMKALLDEFGMKGIEAVVQHASLSSWVDPQMNIGTHSQLVEDLLNANYLFLVSEGKEFLTSSFPAIILNGEDSSGIRFYLPLSPKCAVVYDESQVLRNKRNRVVRIDDEDVRAFNDVLLSQNNGVIRMVISNKDINCRLS